MCICGVIRRKQKNIIPNSFENFETPNSRIKSANQNRTIVINFLFSRTTHSYDYILYYIHLIFYIFMLYLHFFYIIHPLIYFYRQ